MIRRCQYCGRGGPNIYYSVRLERNCCTHCYQAHTPPAPNPGPTHQPADPDPHTRPLDRTLAQLRALYPDAYRLVPGEGPDPDRDPDRWQARCPLHPDGPPSDPFTLEVIDYGGRDPLLTCRLGCPRAEIWRLLRPELAWQLDQKAADTAEALTWAQNWTPNGKANRRPT